MGSIPTRCGTERALVSTERLQLQRVSRPQYPRLMVVAKAADIMRFELYLAKKPDVLNKFGPSRAAFLLDVDGNISRNGRARIRKRHIITIS